MQGTATGAPARQRAWVEVSTQQTALGTSVVVTLEGWDTRVALISVCGNDARRGSRDCALGASNTVAVGADGRGVVDLPITAPPVGCPCVIRVADAFGEGTVRTIPIAIGDFAETTAPLTDDPGTDGIAVVARLRSSARSWPASWFAAFAGPAEQTLVLVVSNGGTTEVAGLRVAAVVGRDRRSGELVAGKELAPLKPGERRRVLMPVRLPAPSFGDYVVYGTVSNLNGALTSFSAETSNDPWALWLVVPAALLVVARLLRRHEKRRAAVSRPAVQTPRVIVIPPLPQSSPDVGASSDWRWATPSYPAAVTDSRQVTPEMAAHSA